MSLWLYRIRLHDGRSFQETGFSVTEICDRLGLDPMEVKRAVPLRKETTPEVKAIRLKARLANLEKARAAKAEKRRGESQNGC